MPEGGEVVGAAVLIVEIVGVLPDVEGEEGLEVVKEGVVGVGFLGDDEFAVGADAEPDPAGAEEGGATVLELMLERFERAEVADYQVGYGAGAEVVGGAELVEIHGVVEELAGVVEEGAGGALDDLGEGLALEAAGGEELVEVVEVGFEVLAVMELEGLGADDAEGVGGVGEGRHGELIVFRGDVEHDG